MNQRWCLHTVVGLVTLGGAVALATTSACTPEPFDTPVDGTLSAEAGAGSGAGCDTKAPKKLEALDPSSLPSCCTDGSTGEAHCVPQDKVPMGYRKAMSPCAGGFCIPDAFIKSGGAKPPSCTSELGAGACVSVCVPAVAAKKGALSRSGCGGADELCAPCINPITKEKTGACEIGIPKPEDEACTPGDGGADAAQPPLTCPYTGPLVDVTQFKECDPAGARCVPESEVPAAQRGLLKKCATGLCVPDPILARRGQYIPPTCTSVAGNEGRCLHVSLPVVASKGDKLPRDTCAADEKCVPCTEPVDGKETGACKLACDPGPKKAPIPFPTCCGGQARCVPNAMVPPEQLSRLNSDGCANANANKCVPKEMLGDKLTPPKCTTAFLAGGGPGVCLSKCLEFGFVESLGIGRQTCDEDHVCVPCTQNGKPTGAPGCT